MRQTGRGGIRKVKIIDVGLDLGADLGLFLLKFHQTVDNRVSQNLVRKKSSLITYDKYSIPSPIDPRYVQSTTACKF